ncbi:MAG: lysoplasmalogenase [Saprospiraceae bacterium]
MRLTKTLLLLFGLTSSLHLLGELLYHQPLQNYTKPLLLPLLAAYFLAAVRFRFTGFNTAIFVGLIFSFLGDVLLLFADRQPQLFIFGLLSFLVTHFCYLFAFLRFPGARRGYVMRQPLIILPFLIFLIAYNAFLMPGIPAELYAPVIFYSVAIITMSISALNLRPLIASGAFTSLFTGALLFVASDSILAFNKFQDQIQIPYVGFLIMLTYIAGQYLIVRGAIAFNESR